MATFHNAKTGQIVILKDNQDNLTAGTPLRIVNILNKVEAAVVTLDNQSELVVASTQVMQFMFLADPIRKPQTWTRAQQAVIAADKAMYILDFISAGHYYGKSREN